MSVLDANTEVLILTTSYNTAATLKSTTESKKKMYSN